MHFGAAWFVGVLCMGTAGSKYKAFKIAISPVLGKFLKLGKMYLEVL